MKNNRSLFLTPIIQRTFIHIKSDLKTESIKYFCFGHDKKRNSTHDSVAYRTSIAVCVSSYFHWVHFEQTFGALLLLSVSIQSLLVMVECITSWKLTIAGERMLEWWNYNWKVQQTETCALWCCNSKRMWGRTWLIPQILAHDTFPTKTITRSWVFSYDTFLIKDQLNFQYREDSNNWTFIPRVHVKNFNWSPVTAWVAVWWKAKDFKDVNRRNKSSVFFW